MIIHKIYNKIFYYGYKNYSIFNERISSCYNQYNNTFLYIITFYI